MMIFLNKLRRNSKAATAIEYGLIAALIAVAGVAAFRSLGGQISTTMGNATNAMATASSS